MRKRLAAILCLGIAFVLSPPAAHAQATRTWVSGVGDDINPCSRTAPCKTWAGAISKTAPGGEVSALDPAGFGAVTITKSITLNGDGTLAGIINAGTSGVIVNATAADHVVLRNLSINGGGQLNVPGAPGGLFGVRFLNGKTLTLDNVTISGSTLGVQMTVAGTAKLFVRDSRITRGTTGIFLQSTAGQAQAMLDNVQLSGLTNGIEAALNGRATISNSMISGNSSNGILASNASARVNVEGCQISFNDIAGVNASVSGATIRLSNNEIYNNNSGITIAAGGIVETAGDNRVAGNVTTAPVLGNPIPKQ